MSEILPAQRRAPERVLVGGGETALSGFVTQHNLIPQQTDTTTLDIDAQMAPTPLDIPSPNETVKTLDIVDESTDESVVPTAEESPEESPENRAREVWKLVERAQNGEQEAFAELYKIYAGIVFKFIYFKVGQRHQAEDLTSETFARALKKLANLSWQGKDLGAWLVTIARNLVADYYKSGRFRFEVSTGDMLEDAPGNSRKEPEIDNNPERVVIDHITHSDLRSAVMQLNPEQRQCISLRFLQGYSVAETAEAMGKNEGAIKALQYRAVRSLHRLLPEGFRS